PTVDLISCLQGDVAPTPPLSFPTRRSSDLAVCGMPRVASIDFLKVHEGFDRQLYSGYLGPVNIDEETHLYVNLRCMQLLASKAAVYAGAGVTVSSNPVKEWQETELKCETLLNVVFGV